MVGLAVTEVAGTTSDKKRAKNDVSDRDVVAMGSGNLGLIYLMEERRRLALEEIDERRPELLPALRAHPHVGWLLVRSSEHGASYWAPTAPLSEGGTHRGRGPARALLTSLRFRVGLTDDREHYPHRDIVFPVRARFTWLNDPDHGGVEG
jgi:hypothetical protein